MYWAQTTRRYSFAHSLKTHKHDRSTSSLSLLPPWPRVRWFKCRTGSLVTNTSGGAVLAWETATTSRTGCNMQSLSKTPQVFFHVYLCILYAEVLFLETHIRSPSSRARMGVETYCLVCYAWRINKTRRRPVFIRSFVLPAFFLLVSFMLNAFVPSRPWNSIPL